MEVPLVLLLARLVAEIAGKSTESSVSDPECCVEMLDSNTSCPVTHHCGPGCFRRWHEDGSSSCVRCRSQNQSLPQPQPQPGGNLSHCRNSGGRGMSSQTNLSTATPLGHSLGGPAVAASLILGTFLTSALLILAVALFFCLKRSSKLPQLFYRSSKASVLQPSETASMIPSPVSSVRKPRYVRRERSAPAPTPLDTRVSHV